MVRRSPRAGVQDSGGLQSTEAEAYVKGQLLPGVTVPLVLLGFAVMALLFFLAWRLLHMCGCCEPDEDPVTRTHSAAAHLKHPMMKAQQVVVVVFALAAWGMAIYGMVKLPTHASTALFSQVGEVTRYADSVAGQVDLTLDAVRGINGSLDSVQGVLDADVDAPGIMAGLQVRPLAGAHGSRCGGRRPGQGSSVSWRVNTVPPVCVCVRAQAIMPFVTGITDPSGMVQAFDSLNASRKDALPRQLTTLSKLANETLGQLLPSADQVPLRVVWGKAHLASAAGSSRAPASEQAGCSRLHLVGARRWPAW